MTQKLTRVSQASNQVYLVVSVRDNGVGMEPDDAAHAFDPTYKSKDPRKHQLNPLGNRIGLSICKQICQRLNGDIQVKSKLG